MPRVAGADDQWMRRRWLAAAALLFAGAAGAAGACGGADEPERAGPPVLPPGAVAENEALLAELPLYPGSRFLSSTDMEAPRGGTGAMRYAYFAAPGAERGAIVEHFASALDGWTVARQVEVVTRTTTIFVRGDAWLSVTASDVATGSGHTPTPGYVIVVDARDAQVLSRD